MNDGTRNLSPDGLRRRQQILELAIGAARRRGRRSSMAKFAMVIGFSALAAVWVWRQEPTSRVAMPAPPRQMPWPATPAPPPSVVWISTDPGIVDRLAIKRVPATWQRIGDDEFLRELADAGTPAGLAQIGDRTLLLPRQPDHR